MLPTFHDQSLLINALTHRSALNENLSTAPQSNERLEYLGDAVLELAATKFLFTKFPDHPEGDLTAFRSALVRTTTLAEVATALKLGDQLFMSKGEEAGGGRKNEGLLANTFEAVTGALYLDQGFETVEQFLTENLFYKMDDIYEHKLYKDAKSLLQEIVQAKGLITPEYTVIKEEGPDHDKMFTVQVSVNSAIIATGVGKSKQLAQQAAARQALTLFE